METREAFGLAANILQFCQAVGSFISQAHEVYRSGPAALGKLNDLRDISKDLHKMLEEMQWQDVYLKEEHPSAPQLTLHNECLAILQDLTRSLDKLGFPEHPSKREAIVITFKSLWKRSKIEELEQRLANFRQQLILGLLLYSPPKDNSPSSTPSTRSLPVDQSVPGKAFFEHLTIRGQLDDTPTKSLWLKDFQTSVIKTISSNKRTETDESPLSNINLPPSRVAELDNGFLASILGPDDMKHREYKKDRQSQIHEAHRQTYQWIFTHTSKTGQPWDSFVDWLESDSLLYWITGKAGSGKSTLMKFISQHPQLLNHVQVWSQGRPVTIASFYFWASGTPMEASSDGLFRSLLHQLLGKHKHIIPKLAPQTWEAAYLFGETMPVVHDDDLRRMLDFTIREINQTSRICLIIDGLDEFKGKSDDILDTIRDFVSLSVKVCAASRPWVVFEEAFYQKPQLLLQNLNRQDMEVYVKSMLLASRGFRRLQAREPHFAEQLTMSIVDKAQGVFLWVCLVVRSLLTGMNNDDRISDLQRRLNALPPDLEELYDAIVETWDPFYLQHAAQYFKLRRAHTTFLDARIFYLADSEDITYAIESDSRPVSYEEYQSQIETIRRRLNSRCMGLLELTNTNTNIQKYTVEYLHRTVRDYVTRSDVQDRLRATIASFDPYLQFCAAYLVAIKSLPSVKEAVQDARKLTASLQAYGALVSARWVASRNTTTMIKILDEVARVLELEQISCWETASAWNLVSDEPRASGLMVGFLSLVTREGVIEYVRNRVGESTATLSELLIDAAKSRSNISLDMFRLLLDLGADFSYQYQHPSGSHLDTDSQFTVWSEILAVFIFSPLQSHAPLLPELEIAGAKCNEWLPILEFLLRRGAPVDEEVQNMVRVRCDSIRKGIKGNLLFSGLVFLREDNKDKAHTLFCELLWDV